MPRTMIDHAPRLAARGSWRRHLTPAAVLAAYCLAALVLS